MYFQVRKTNENNKKKMFTNANLFNHNKISIFSLKILTLYTSTSHLGCVLGHIRSFNSFFRPYIYYKSTSTDVCIEFIAQNIFRLFLDEKSLFHFFVCVLEFSLSAFYKRGRKKNVKEIKLEVQYYKIDDTLTTFIS